MQVEWLHSFVVIAEHGSLSKASDHLHLSQPAVSKQLRSLERDLGASLFDRSPTGVKLTEAGRVLYDRVQPILREMNLLFADLQEFSKHPAIQLGTLPSLASNFLPTRMTAGKEHSVEVHMKIESTSSELVASLHAGQLHAVIAEKQHLASPYWQKTLFEEPYVAVVPETHPLATSSFVTVESLAPEQLILHPPQCDIRSTIVRMYEQCELTPRVAIEVPFGDSILGFVQAGAGITIVPNMLAQQAGRGLRALPIIDFTAKRSIALMARSEEVGRMLMRRLSLNVLPSTIKTASS